MKPSAAELPEWLQHAYDDLQTYAEVLASDGVDHGLIGPREVPRLWTRHILNCAVVGDPALDLVPASVRVADVGSGAGLPGLVWAIARPDLEIVLIEPLLRRSGFLTAATERLGLTDRVTVLRGRAEDLVRQSTWQPVDVVTARAVAGLEKLLAWTIPLLAPGGRLVALKGSSASQEVADADALARSLGVTDLRVTTCGAGVVDPATTVVVGTRGRAQ